MRPMINQATTNLLVVATMLLTGCVTVTPAPGSDKVRVTVNPTDVTTCKPVGNIAVPRSQSGTVDLGNASTEFRNRAIGFGGNAALVTSGSLDVPVEGIAYICQ
jgi:hypothetical protein